MADKAAAAGKLVDNDNLMLSVYKDKMSGGVYVSLVDTKDNSGVMITAEALMRAYNLVEEMFQGDSSEKNTVIH